MEPDLEGKCIFVTGATQGLGAEIARESARRGAASIAICGRNSEKGEVVVEELKKLGADARFFNADLIAPEVPQRLIAEVAAWNPNLDGLVNCAGMTDRGSFLDGTPAIWDRLFALNTRAPFFLMQAFIQQNIAAKRSGSIVNIISMNAHCGAPELAIYSATKGALIDINNLDIYLGEVQLMQAGQKDAAYTEAAGAAVVAREEICIRIDINEGDYVESVWTSDLSHDYVTINTEYRT